MTSEHLKPCPFCGGEATLKDNQFFSDKHFYVGCVACGIYTDYVPLDKARAAWNRRPTPTPDEARVIGPARLQPYEGGVLAWTGTADSITEPDPAAQAEAAERDEALYSREYHCGTCGGVLGPEYSTCTCDDDPAAELRDNLRELVALARECGAEGVVIVREALMTRLYIDSGADEPTKMIPLGTGAPLLVVLRFAASDGGAAGVEVVEG